MTTNFTCPHCLKQFAITPIDIPEYQTPWQKTTSFQSVSQGSINSEPGPTYGQWQKVTPVGKLQPKDIAVAILDSTIVFGLVSAPLGLMCHWSDLPWQIGPFVGLICGTLRYVLGMANTWGLLTVRETWQNQEPGQQAADQRQEHLVTVAIKERKRWEYAHLGIEPAKLSTFAEALLSGASFTEREAGKYGINQLDLKHIREEFINRGLAYWNNPGRPQQGITIRHSGYTVLQAIIDSTQQHAATS